MVDVYPRKQVQRKVQKHSVGSAERAFRIIINYIFEFGVQCAGMCSNPVR
jgi:hypothetical protein